MGSRHWLSADNPPHIRMLFKTNTDNWIMLHSNRSPLCPRAVDNLICPILRSTALNMAASAWSRNDLSVLQSDYYTFYSIVSSDSACPTVCFAAVQRPENLQKWLGTQLVGRVGDTCLRRIRYKQCQCPIGGPLNRTVHLSPFPIKNIEIVIFLFYRNWQAISPASEGATPIILCCPPIYYHIAYTCQDWYISSKRYKCINEDSF